MLQQLGQSKANAAFQITTYLFLIMGWIITVMPYLDKFSHKTTNTLFFWDRPWTQVVLGPFLEAFCWRNLFLWSDSTLLVSRNPWGFLVFSGLQGRSSKDDAVLVFCLSLSCCLVLFKK